MGTRDANGPSTLILVVAGLVSGAVILGVLTTLGVGPFGDPASASRGAARFVVATGSDPGTTSTTTAPPATQVPATTTTTTLAPTTTTTGRATTTVPPTTTQPLTTEPPATTAPPPTEPPPPPPPTSAAPTEQAYLTSIRGSTIDQGPNWIAVVTVHIDTASGSGVSAATVSGIWSVGGEAGSCTTDGTGSCTVFQSSLTDADPSTTFVVNAVTTPGYSYAGALTGGSQVTVTQP